MATVLDELLVKLGFDADTKGADFFDSKLGGIIKTAGKVGAALGGVGVVAAGFLGKSLLDTASQFEQFKTQLTTIEGSSEKAQKSLDWISDFAKKTPYELAEVTDAFVKMKSYGLDPIKGDFMTSIGNMASGMGKSIDQAVEAVADAVTGENERLKEFGIKASKDSGSNTVTYTYSSNGETFKKTVKQDAQEIQTALQEIMDQRFDGGMEAMSKTWAGTISNLQDTWQAFLMQIAAAGVFDLMKDGLTGLADWINNNGDKIQATAKAIGDGFVLAINAIGDAYTFIADTIQWLDDNSEQIKSTLLTIGIIAGIVAGALALMYGPTIAGFIAMRVIALTSFLIMQAGAIASALATAAAWAVAFAPFLLVAALVAAAVAAFWYLYQNWDTVVAYIKAAWDSFVALFNAGIARVKAVFANVMSTLSNLWSGFWNGAKNIAMGVINAVIGAIQSIISSIGNAIGKVKDLAKYMPHNLVKNGAKWVAGKLSGGSSSSSSSVNQTFNVSSAGEATSIARGSLSGTRSRNTGVRQ